MANNDETLQGQRALLDQWEKYGQAEFQKRAVQLRENLTLPPEVTLSEGIALFLATLRGQSAATARTYRAGCRRFMWFIYSSGRGIPSEITVYSLSPLVLEEFYLWLVDTFGRKARATHSSYMAATRNLFEYLASRELTPNGSQYQKMIARLSKLQGRASYRTPRVRGKQVEQVARSVLNSSGASSIISNSINNAATIPNEASIIDNSNVVPKKAVKASKDPAEVERRHLEELRDRAVILTLFTTGMRRAEVAGLNRDELEPLIDDYLAAANDITKNNLIFELIITGKGQKERVVYFDSVTLAALNEYLVARQQTYKNQRDQSNPLFLQHHRGRSKVKAGVAGENYRVSLVTIWQIVVKYAKRLGVEVKPHDFRHNLATTLLNAGAQLSEVQDILGHASPTTTKQIYAHYDKGHLKEAFSRYRKDVSDS